MPLSVLEERGTAELLSREVGTFTALSFYFTTLPPDLPLGYFFINSRPNHEFGIFVLYLQTYTAMHHRNWQ